MTTRITDVLSGMQIATMATFVDLPNIFGLGIVNIGAAMFKQASIPLVADNSMIGIFLVSCVEGATDLVKWYYLKANANIPTGGGAMMGP